MPASIHTIPLQGLAVPVVRQGTGTPLLLLHGGDGPQDQRAFFQQLVQHFDVIAPVHPGFAGSAFPEHFDTLEDLVYLYLDLLDALDLQHVVCMGFDMGGWVAVELAVRNTSRLARLILVDAVGIKPGGRDTRDIADIFGMSAAEVARLLFHNPECAPPLPSLTDGQATSLAANCIAYAQYTWQPYMHNPKLRHRLHRITVPTLLIWGGSDGMVPVTYAEAYRALIPGSQLVVIPEAGHLPQVEQPDVFLQHVLAFAAP